MTFLQLINNVLTRLRENTIVSYDPQTADPYIRSIAAHVNDAKDRVEDAWQWGALRGTDVVPLVAGTGGQYDLPNSADNHYVLKRMQARTLGDPASQHYLVKWVTIGDIRMRYAHPATAPSGNVMEFAVTGTGATGDVAITVYPVPAGTQELVVDRVNHQPTLEMSSDRLLVPSLPVYTLATALASRERGEVGGTPTSELFAIADRHLSDAIAQDSALYANELDWYSDTRLSNTNVKFA